MAASADKNPWEETICSICLDYFKEPVTLECGHNLRGTCLTQWCEKSADTDDSCPFYWAKVLQKNLIKNWQLANIIAAAKKLNPSYEGEKGGKQEPQKNDYEDDETISVEFDRSKEHYDYRVISLGKAVQDCKNQEEVKMEKSLGEITRDCWFLEDQNKHLWAQIEEMEHQVERKTNDHNRTLVNGFLRMQDEFLLDRNSLLQKSEKKETFKKPGTFFSGLKWKNREFSDQKSDQSPFMKRVQASFLLQTAIVILEALSACFFLNQSAGRKSVNHGTEPQDLCDNPEKFSNPIYVFRSKGFTKHIYAEGFVKEREGIWPVEVATKSVRGKGQVPIGPKERMWAMGKWIDSYPDTSLPCGSVLSLSEKTKETPGYLNSAAGQVGFFDGEMGAQIEAISEVPLSAVSVRPFFYI